MKCYEICRGLFARFGLGNLKGLFSSATFDLLQSNTNNLAFGKVASFWENRQSTVFPNPLSVFKKPSGSYKSQVRLCWRLQSKYWLLYLEFLPVLEDLRNDGHFCQCKSLRHIQAIDKEVAYSLWSIWN